MRPTGLRYATLRPTHGLRTAYVEKRKKAQPYARILQNFNNPSNLLTLYRAWLPDLDPRNSEGTIASNYVMQMMFRHNNRHAERTTLDYIFNRLPGQGCAASSRCCCAWSASRHFHEPRPLTPPIHSKASCSRHHYSEIMWKNKPSTAPNMCTFKV